MANRQQRRAERKVSKSPTPRLPKQTAAAPSNTILSVPERSGEGLPAPVENSAAFDFPQLDWYYHVNIHDGSKDRDAKNIAAEDVLIRILIPFKLNQRFRVDGYEIIPARVQRLKVTRTKKPFNPGELTRKLDMSSISTAFVTLAAMGQELSGGEDVTDDMLIQASQRIASQGMKPEPSGALDTPIHSDKAFIVMSFAPENRESFDAIKEACEKSKIKAIRVDQEISSGPVMERIKSHLKEANYVIADLTGARPNVYYEIGYFDALCEARGVDPSAHMLFIARDISTDAHFDIRHRGIEQYGSAFALMKIIERWLGVRKAAIAIPLLP